MAYHLRGLQFSWALLWELQILHSFLFFHEKLLMITTLQALRKVGKDHMILMLCVTVFLSYLPEAGQYSCIFVYLRLVRFVFNSCNVVALLLTFICSLQLCKSVYSFFIEFWYFWLNGASKTVWYIRIHLQCNIPVWFQEVMKFQ
jgi:hypothetical protein